MVKMVGKSKKVGASKADGFLSLSAADDKKAVPEPSSSGQSRVIYIGHLPHGFAEKPLLSFFSQFGKLTRVRLSRNKKSGKARGYAFLEFQYPDVAEIAAEAMNGYFLFKQKLDVHLMKAEDIHPELFKNANKKFRNVPWRKIERQRHDKDLNPAEYAKRVSRAIARDSKRQKKITKAGIEYTYVALRDQQPAKAKKTVFDE